MTRVICCLTDDKPQVKPLRGSSMDNTFNVNSPLIVWVFEYYDTVAGEKSLDLYLTEKMARDDAKKLKDEGIITDVLIYARRVWQ